VGRNDLSAIWNRHPSENPGNVPSMGVFRFYILVVRTAFSHSLSVAQDIIFGAILLVGGGVWVAPHVGIVTDYTPWLNALSGWKIAAATFGSIVLSRLFLAPYWLWKEQKDKVIGLSVDFPKWALDINGDVSDKMMTGAQSALLRLNIKNTTDIIIQIFPSECIISDNGTPEITKILDPFVLRPEASVSYTWDFDPIIAKIIPGQVTIKGNILYGLPSGQPNRKAYREINIKYHTMLDIINSQWSNVTESDEEII
jgi:hypothetical protein